MILLSSRVYYKNPSGGITKRTPDHFWKRTVVFEDDNNIENQIDIPKEELGIEATIEDIENYILANLKFNSQ